MAIDTLLVYVGVYDRVGDAEADYQVVKELHTDAGLIDAYDAAVIERREGGKTKIVKKHETPARAGGVLGGGVGWPPVWSSRCSRSRPSAGDCSRARPRAARSSVRLPGMRRRA
jgi:hypothetical protein